MPANLANLSHRLPKANYATLQSDEVSLERMPVSPLEAMHASQSLKLKDSLLSLKGQNIGEGDGLRAPTER